MTITQIDLESQVQLAAISREHPKAHLRRAAKIILLYLEGLPTREVSRQTGISPSRARYWRRQFAARGMALFPSFVEPVETVEQADRLPGDKKPKGHKSSPVVEAANLEQVSSLPNVDETETSNQQPKEEIFQPAKPSKPTAVELWAALTPRAIARMAKAKKAGISPEDPLAEAARKILHYHFIQMLSHEEGTCKGEDIEELHDMRVATRRMRAAFDVFEGVFQNKAIKEHHKGLRLTGRTLGRVRDMDVFIEKANLYLETRPARDREELGPLISAWQDEREKNRQKMLAYLESERYQDYKQKFYIFLKSPGEGVQPKSDGQFSPWQVRESAPLLIYSRLAAVRVFEPLISSASLEQLHAVRIELKRMRYTLEFFREVLGEEAGVVIDELKVIQDHLGDLHDAQVATQILRDFLVQWDQRQDELPVEQRQSPDPIINYLSSRYSERQRLMTSFRGVWEHFNRPELREKLAMAVAVL